MIINNYLLGIFYLFFLEIGYFHPNFAIVKGAMHHSLHPKK